MLFRKIEGGEVEGLLGVAEDVARCPITGKDTNLIYQGYPGMRPLLVYSNEAAKAYQRRELSKIAPRNLMNKIIELCYERGTK